MILPKTSTTKILTNRFGSAASDSAAVDPVIPTQTPQRRLHAPTVRPPQKRAKPSMNEFNDRARGERRYQCSNFLAYTELSLQLM